MKKTLLAIPLLLIAGLASAGPQNSIHSIVLPNIQTELKAGEGREKTQTLCAICHSLDYITMQPRLMRTQWTATVNKMMKFAGAVINENDAQKIIGYLTMQYGSKK
ncbi:MAG: cytochrome C [Thermodesulfobacteriota bacterium]|jgi:cytochrome c2